MAATIESNSETDGPAGSQGPDGGPTSPPQDHGSGHIPQTLNLAGTSWEVDGQVAQAYSGRSWLTHAWVVFESPKEGKKQEGGMPIPGAQFLE